MILVYDIMEKLTAQLEFQRYDHDDKILVLHEVKDTDISDNYLYLKCHQVKSIIFFNIYF